MHFDTGQSMQLTYQPLGTEQEFVGASSRSFGWDPFSQSSDAFEFLFEQNDDVENSEYVEEASFEDVSDSFQYNDVNEVNEEDEIPSYDFTIVEEPEEESDAWANQRAKKGPKATQDVLEELQSMAKSGMDDDDFVQDLKAILNGDGAYDEETKKVVDPSSKKKSSSNEANQELDLPHKNEHEIFNKIAQSMQYANSYDLGNVSVVKTLDAFDKEADALKEKKKIPDKVKQAEIRQAPEGTKKIVGAEEFVQDIGDILRNDIAPNDIVPEVLGSKMMFDPKQPLNKTNGGRSIGLNDLRPGDIVVTKDGERLRGGLFIGQQKVWQNGKEVLLKHGVVLRHDQVSEEKSGQMLKLIEGFAPQKENEIQNAEVKMMPMQVMRSICDIQSNDANKKACQLFAGRIDFGLDDTTEVHLDESIFDVFKKAGLSISTQMPDWSKAEEIKILTSNGALKYVGHLEITNLKT